MSNLTTQRAPQNVSGGQVITRATSLLRLLSAAMPDGMSTSKITEMSGLKRPTVHRILTILLKEGFVDRNSLNGNWLLGPELYLLGSVAADRYDITQIATKHLNELADETGESAFLSVRRGNESVCLTRVDGSFPIRSFVLYEGVRFPLGVASAGIAMLAFESEKHIDSYLEQESFKDSHGVVHSNIEIRSRIKETRELGYAVNPGLVVEGSWGMAAAIFSPAGTADWALSLTGVDTRFRRERRPYLGKLLLEHAHKITQRLRANT